jgi:hypothetical protein
MPPLSTPRPFPPQSSFCRPRVAPPLTSFVSRCIQPCKSSRQSSRHRPSHIFRSFPLPDAHFRHPHLLAPDEQVLRSHFSLLSYTTPGTPSVLRFFWTDGWVSYIRTSAPLHMSKDAVIDRRLSVDFHSLQKCILPSLVSILYLLVSYMRKHFHPLWAEAGGQVAGRIDHVASTSTSGLARPSKPTSSQKVRNCELGQFVGL